ncbi:MAG: hypothetical protein LBB14_03025, partial [Puniceicoccales bacterium]|nr:hypothetical protein [Puniceicoccales bacterium]
MARNTLFLEPFPGGPIFNETKFFRDAEAVHLTFEEAVVYSQTQDSEVRGRANEYVNYEPEFEGALDEICSNVVGRTLF